MATLPRMRNAEGVLKELKAQDPDTKISLYFIRGLIRSGEIPVVQAGRQRLVNMDLVFEFLANNGTNGPISYRELAREGVSA